jgi:branched-subunit amino acid permease
MIFILDIAVAMELFALAVGALLLVYSERGTSSNIGKWVAYFVMVATALGLACTVYYGLKYRGQGAFDKPSPMACPMMQGKMMMDSEK